MFKECSTLVTLSKSIYNSVQNHNSLLMLIMFYVIYLHNYIPVIYLHDQSNLGTIGIS